MLKDNINVKIIVKIFKTVEKVVKNMASESENSWLKDMNSLADTVCAMETEDISIRLEDRLSKEAYAKYEKLLRNPQWEVFKRPDALYSRLGLQLESYPLTRSTPSAYQSLLNQVSTV